jgi:hypothetical protein
MLNYENIKVAVCIPARDQMHTATTFCLYNLANVLTSLDIDNKLFISPGTLIVNQRHELIKSAQDWQATHVMFIDSDIEFQPYHVTNLIDFDEDIVGAAYSKRVAPFVTTAWKEIDKWSTYVRPLEQTDSHIKVAAMGLGFCLIKMSVFDKLELPWFQLGFHNGQYTGEDIEFFRKCKDFDIWLDVQTTCELGHLGTKSYKVDGGIEVDLET